MHKKSKIIFFVCVLLSLSSAQAGNQFLYFGAEPVYSITSFDWVNMDSSSDTNPSANGQAVINGNSSNTNAGIFAGYGILADQVYLGLEGATQFGKREATSQTQDFNTKAALNNKATMSDIYILDFRPGYVLGAKNNMLYGVLGINSADFDATQTDVNDVVVQNSGSIRRTGFRLGAGYSLGLSHYVMARAEYVYTKFSKFDFTDTYPDGSQTHTWQLNPSSNEISIGLSCVIHI